MGIAAPSAGMKKGIKKLDNFGRSHKMRASFGLLAQLVEQRTLNPFVAGSIPAQPTNKINGLQQCRPFFVFAGVTQGLRSALTHIKFG
jgi:hypothetical protein